MKKYFLILVILLLSAALSVYAVDPRELKFAPLEFKPPVPERFVTDNGVIVYFLAQKELPVVTANLLFHGGTAYDPADRAGLAEMTASLLRSGGAGRRSPEQVDEELDFTAIGIGSAASDDEMTLSMQTLKKDVSLAFEILSDMIIEPRFDSAKVATEISNRMDDIRRQNDDPRRVTRRVFYETIYTGHPYGLSPTLASMGGITREDILALHKKYYSPNNCLLSVSGDLTLDEVKEIVGKYFGSWKKSDVAISALPMAAMQYNPGVYYAERDINQAQIRLGHLCMDIKNPDRQAMDVVNFALGSSGFTSRLMQQIRTTAGLAYSVGSYNINRPLMGVFFGFCETRADAMAQATGMMLDIIREVKDKGITEEEMTLARESLLNSYVFNYDTPDKIASAAASLEFYGFPPDQLQRNVDALKAVTLEDCNRVAQKYLAPDKCAIIVTGNRSMFDKPLETFGPVTDVSMEIK